MLPFFKHIEVFQGTRIVIPVNFKNEGLDFTNPRSKVTLRDSDKAEALTINGAITNSTGLVKAVFVITDAQTAALAAGQYTAEIDIKADNFGNYSPIYLRITVYEQGTITT